MKKILITLTVIFVFCYSGFILAQNESSTIYFFHSNVCPHCIAENKVLKSIEKSCPEVTIERHEISDVNNQKMMQDYAEKYGVPADQREYVPLTIIGQDYFVGFSDDIKTKIESHLTQDCLAKVNKASFNFVPFISVAVIIILALIFLAYKKKWYTK